MKALSPLSMNSRRTNRARAGFSLVEMMVAVALLGVVMFAMYSLFNQTQKALRTAVGQADVNEPARAALDLIADNLRQAGATGIPGVTNFFVRYFTDLSGANPTRLPPWVETAGPRQRPHHEVYFLRQVSDKRWDAAGFFVGLEPTEVAGQRVESPWPPPVGTLYFYVSETNVLARGNNLVVNRTTANEFHTRLVADFHNTDLRTRLSSRVVDGVAVFRVMAYDGWGRLMDEYSLTQLMGFKVTNGLYRPNIRVGPPSTVSLSGTLGAVSAPAIAATFFDDEIPASLEIELGILEPKTFEAYRSVRDAGPEAALAFLERNQGRIQMYRRRVDLRTAPRPLLP